MNNFGTVLEVTAVVFCLRHSILGYIQAFSWRQVYRAECTSVTTFLVAVIATLFRIPSVENTLTSKP